MPSLRVPDYIKEMQDKIRPWRIGVGIFKEGTPQEIIDMDKKVTDWYREQVGDFQ